MRCEKCGCEIDRDIILQLCNCCFEEYIKNLDFEYYEMKGEKDMRKHIKKCTVIEKLNEYSKDTLIEYIITEGFINFMELDRIQKDIEKMLEGEAREEV